MIKVTVECDFKGCLATATFAAEAPQLVDRVMFCVEDDWRQLPDGWRGANALGHKLVMCPAHAHERLERLA